MTFAIVPSDLNYALRLPSLCPRRQWQEVPMQIVIHHQNLLTFVHPHNGQKQQCQCNHHNFWVV